MKNIAIITARGGSKRIPKKNIKDFYGKPIITYSIQAALDAKIFSEVMVSTDSEEIADISRSFGARVPFLRSHKNSDDFATTDDALIEVIERYEDNGNSFENLCCLYPTAPFLTAKKIVESYEMLISKNADSVLTMTEFSFPIQRALRQTEGRVTFREPLHRNTRSQDLERTYHDAGQLYWKNIDAFKKNKIGRAHV